MLSGNAVKTLRCPFDALHDPLRLTTLSGNGALGHLMKMTATSVDALKERSNITSIRLISRVVEEVCAALQQPLREFAKKRTLCDQWSEEGEYSFPPQYITPVVGEWQEGGGQLLSLTTPHLETDRKSVV